jgi:23S rRNA (adenine2503-C2)-methyltransferase
MTARKIPLLALTEKLYQQAIFQRLGKGEQHASRIYSQVMRSGKIDRSDPHFNNSQRLVDEIESLTDLTTPFLAEQLAAGNTGKFLLCTPDKLYIEAVRIPMQAGGTLCVSSQVGCRMGCAFCETGRMGLLRNLSAEEIVAQVYIAKHQLHFDMRNVVFMGMGEPFDNYDAVMQAVRVLTDPKGLGFGKRHLTISTSGLTDGIGRFTDEVGEMPNLAVSISAADDSLRNRLMPINRKHDLQKLYAAMHAYNQKCGREILIAYVLLQGINDSLVHADSLANYLQGLLVKINVIPYNRQSNERFMPSDLETIDGFVQRLRDHGYYTLRRTTKGDEIMAACGQLGNLALKASRQKKSLAI